MGAFGLIAVFLIVGLAAAVATAAAAVLVSLDGEPSRCSPRAPGAPSGTLVRFARVPDAGPRPLVTPSSEPPEAA